jgi:hypothetical protein
LAVSGVERAERVLGDEVVGLGHHAADEQQAGALTLGEAPAGLAERLAEPHRHALDERVEADGGESPFEAFEGGTGGRPLGVCEQSVDRERLVQDVGGAGYGYDGGAGPNHCEKGRPWRQTVGNPAVNARGQAVRAVW